MDNKVQLFTSADGVISLEVSLDQETTWLSLDQMGYLFARDKLVNHATYAMRSLRASWRGIQLLQKKQQLPPMVKPTKWITTTWM
jgi:hypothetical protein